MKIFELTGGFGQVHGPDGGVIPIQKCWTVGVDEADAIARAKRQSGYDGCMVSAKHVGDDPSLDVPPEVLAMTGGELSMPEPGETRALLDSIVAKRRDLGHGS
jgi:hypothetical protein